MFRNSSLTIDFIGGERRKYIHMFENIREVVFVVDLLSYNYEISAVCCPHSLWRETMMLFDEYVNSR